MAELGALYTTGMAIAATIIPAITVVLLGVCAVCGFCRNGDCSDSEREAATVPVGRETEEMSAVTNLMRAA